MGKTVAKQREVIVEDGRIVIPDDLRERLGIENHSRLILTVRGGKLVLSKAAVEPEDNVRIYTDEELAEFMEEDKLTPELAEWVKGRYGSTLL